MGMDGRLSLPLKTRKRHFCQPLVASLWGTCKGFVRENKKEYSRNSRFEVFPHSSLLHAFGRWDIYTKNVSQKACSCLESRFIVVGGSLCGRMYSNPEIRYTDYRWARELVTLGF